MSRATVILAIFCISLCNLAEASDLRIKACVTQPDTICPAGTTARFSCHTPLSEIGKTVCTIHSLRGNQTYEYDIKKISDVGGGECGTAAFDVVCHGMPNDSRIEWSANNCIASHKNLCRNYEQQDCSHTLEWFAKYRCNRGGVIAPYQVFASYSASGGGCGVTYVLVGCHVPAQ